MKEIDLEKKGMTITELEEIEIIENNKHVDFNFEPIYELGRLISEGNIEFAMKSLEKITPGHNETLKENVKIFFKRLAQDVLSKSLSFKPIVIDFVLFDPDDRQGERFHIAICSTSASLIKKYIEEVSVNIDGNKPEYSDNPQKRGPILTNSNIYKSPYFYRGPDTRTNNLPAKFHEIKLKREITSTKTNNPKRNYIDTMQIYFGSFRVQRENKLSLASQKGHIELFFDKIEEQLYKGEGLIKHHSRVIDDEQIEFNTSLLMPLLRPAASFEGDKDFRLRGGGLFAYGNTPPEASITEIVARLQHFFYRNILNESHTQMVYDYLRHEGANHMIHDFRTFLTSEFIDKIERVSERTTTDSLSQDELMEVVRDATTFRKYLTETLEAYRDFRFDKDGEKKKVNRPSVWQLEELIKKASTLEGTTELKVKFINKVQDVNKGIRVDPVVLNKIFGNLFSNSIAEYKRRKIELEKRKVDISFFTSSKEGEEPEILTIEYFNEGLRFNSANIRKFGISPIASNSTGMGGYFINNTLGWLLAEENKHHDEVTSNIKRYIRVENTDEGVSFTFKFKLLNR